MPVWNTAVEMATGTIGGRGYAATVSGGEANWATTVCFNGSKPKVLGTWGTQIEARSAADRWVQDTIDSDEDGCG